MLGRMCLHALLFSLLQPYLSERILRPSMRLPAPHRCSEHATAAAAATTIRALCIHGLICFIGGCGRERHCSGRGHEHRPEQRQLL